MTVLLIAAAWLVLAAVVGVVVGRMMAFGQRPVERRPGYVLDRDRERP